MARNATFLVAIAASLFVAAPARSDTLTANFSGRGAVSKEWPLGQLDHNLPSDWTGYSFLVLEFRASSPQRFDLSLRTPQQLISKRIHPFQNTLVRAAIPLKYFSAPPSGGMDLASLVNHAGDSYFINIENGGYGPLNHVLALGVTMHDPVGSPTLQILSVSLAKTSPGDAVLDPKVVVDPFGQWIPADWPGKAKSLADLQNAWAREDQSLGTNPVPGRDQYGGFADTSAKATGFFRVEQIAGRWWFIDPAGHYFWSSGANGIGASSGTRAAGRESIFAAQAPAVQPTTEPAATQPATDASANFAPANSAAKDSTAPSAAADSNPAATANPTTTRDSADPPQPRLVSYYTWNLQRRYGDNWKSKWASLTVRRLADWGVNTINGREAELLAATPRQPYVAWASKWQSGKSYMGLADVYARDFKSKADAIAASSCDAHRNDPYLIGYFIGNEPSWPGREKQLTDLILASPPSAIQAELKRWLADQGDSPKTRRDFALRAFERYLTVIIAAVKKHDPHHLILGIRFGGKPPDEVIRFGRLFDVYSHNIYSQAPDPARLNHYYELTGRPILIGEFHFGVPGRGMSAGLVQAATQDDRARMYSGYVENAAANPNVIGAHWFEWIDEPNTGRPDGENYNIGMIDVTDRPYPQMIAAMKQTHARIMNIHLGTLAPTTRRSGDEAQ